MQINIAGHHVDVTDGIRESINHKFKKIGNHYPDLNTITITLTVERHEQKIEVHALYRGIAVSVSAVDTDLYVAIANVVRKLDSSLASRKSS